MKLKLTNEQLQILAAIASPNYFERKAVDLVEENEYMIASTAFNLMDIGERAAQKVLFSNKEKHTLRLSNSEACSLLNHVLNVSDHPKNEFHSHVAEVIKTSLHAQLTNYQLRFK